eukprot:Anaeramoba_ignava/c21302_g1_i1.p1 GENE.c21302_g1_i1~~c21302_g1_i1.p1  ORF type:complete len:1280 (-),score=443.77 c21302_g1_i1:143-3982(-)
MSHVLKSITNKRANLAKRILGRTRTMSDQSDLPSYTKHYTTIGGKGYSSPDINVLEQINVDSQNQRFPANFDRNGNFYDLYFDEINPEKFDYSIPEKEIDNETNEEQKQQKIKEQKLYEKLPKNVNQAPKFPKAEDFKTFSDFEQAIIDWENEMNRILGVIRLPEIIGCIRPRPYLYQDQTEKQFDIGERSSVTESERLSSDQKKFSDSGRKSSTDIRSSFTKESAKTSLSKQSDLFDDKKKSISLEDDRIRLQKGDKLPDFFEDTHLVMTDHESWRNNLIPIEPEESHYDTFEEFEAAYKKWAQTIVKTTPQLPPHSTQLSEMYGLITANEIDERMRKRKEEENARLFKERVKRTKKKQIPEINRYYYWISKLNLGLSLSLICTGNLAIENLSFLVLKKTKEQIKEEERIHKQKVEKNEQLEKEKAKQREKSKKQNENEDIILKLSMTHEDRDKLENISEHKKKHQQPILIMDENTKSLVKEFLQKIIDKKNKNHEFYRTLTQPIIGKIHGTLPKNLLNSPNNQVNEQKGGLMQTSISSFYLRRTDLTGPMINSSMDCPSEIDGVPVFFSIPRYNISEPIDLKKINDLTVRNHLKTDLAIIENELRLDHIQYWYHPSRFPKEKFEEQKQLINEIIQRSPTFTIENVRQILCIEMCIDQFLGLLSQTVNYQNREISYLGLFVSCLDANNFEQILQLFEETLSLKIHAQISKFVGAVLQENVSKQIFEKYLLDRDLNNLYYIAYAMNFFTPIPSPLFPRTPELRSISNILFSTESLSIEQSILAHYYLKIIWNGLQRDPQNFANAITQIQQYLKNLQNSFVMTIQSNPKFLTEEIFAKITSRSILISGYYLILFIYLIRANDPVINEIMSQMNLIEKIKKTTKLTHIQFSKTQIWKELISSFYFKQFLIKHYSQSVDTIIKELQPPPKPETSDQEENKKASDFVVLLRLFLHKAFSEIKIQSDIMNSPIATPNLYFELFKHLENLVKQNYANETLIHISAIIKNIVDAFYRSNNIEVSEKDKKTIIMASSLKKKMIISEKNILDILAIVASAPHSLDEMKRKLIASLTYILRNDQIFQLVVESNSFFPQFINLFRDCKDYELSRQLWKIYYHSIKYHNDVVNHLKKINHLKSMIELVSTSSDRSVTDVGLKVLHKILTMNQREEIRIQKGKDPSRLLTKDPLKKMEKDIKMFSDFFEKNTLFVKIHMIYKNFGDDFPGQKFVNLAHVYHAITTNPLCSKFYRECIKKPDYKTGLEKIRGFFGEDEKSKKGKKDRKKGKRK